MKENKNTVPVLQHLDGVELKSVRRAALLCSEQDCITRRGPIARLLSDYREPVTAAQLAAVLELPDVRTVTKLVQRERLHGAPICASCEADKPGFYLARCPEELDHYLKSLRRRIRKVSNTYFALEATRDAWRGQMRLDGWEVDDAE